MLNVDFVSKMEAKDKKKIITKKGCQKYKKFIKQRQMSKIIKKGTLQESCNKWTEEVGDAIKQHYNKCSHRETKTKSKKHIPIFC